MELPVRILGTASLDTGKPVSTDEVADDTGRDRAKTREATGITTRRWFDPKAATFEGLGGEVLSMALERAGVGAKDLRRVILVTSTGGDLLVPASANGVIDALGASGTCDAFDLNNACMGFLTAFDVAACTVTTGRAPVAVVVVEWLSRHISPEQARPYLVLGDAAAAMVLGPGEEGYGVQGFSARNDGRYYKNIYLKHPNMTGKQERITFEAENHEIADAVVKAACRVANEAVEEAGMTLGDVEWLVPHQPNGPMLDMMLRALGVPLGPKQRAGCPGYVRVIDDVGSLGAASVPLGLDRLFRKGCVEEGDHILMIGVGAGMSQGALLYRHGP